MQSIHTIEVWNDNDQFRKQVNDCLKEGYKILSANCDFNRDGTGTYDTVWQAILIIDEK
jgi:ribulose bisphosphate carboxylase small subunit